MLQKIFLTTKSSSAKIFVTRGGVAILESVLTNSEQFHAFILEFFGRCLNIILRFSISDKNTDFSSSRSHASLGLEALLANEIQGHP